jgi:hypothetical protein
MSAYTLTPSLAISGWGDPVTGLPYRLREASTASIGSTVLPAPILSDWPEAIADKLGEKLAKVEVGTLSFAVAELDSSDEGASLMEFLYQGAPEPWGGLLEDITLSATAIKIVRILGEDVPTAPCNLFLEREVMRCTVLTWNGGGWWDATVTRGRYGTKAIAHRSDDKSDRYVYSRNPIADTREVVLYDLDVDTDTESQVWTGVLEQPDGNGGVCRLTAMPSHGGLRDVVFGAQRLSWPATLTEPITRPEELWLDYLAQSRVYPGTLLPDGNRVMATDGEVVVLGTTLPYGVPGTPDVPLNGVFNDGSNYGRTVEAYNTKRKLGETKLFEALIAGDAGHPYEEWCMVRNDSGDLSCHPIDIVVCLLMSSGTATWPSGGSHSPGNNGDWDWLSRHWGLDIRDSMVDISGIVELRDSYLFRDLRCPSFILSDAKPPRATEVIRRLLEPLMCFLALDEEGRYTIRSLLDVGASPDLTISDFDLVAGPERQPFTFGELYRSPDLKLGRVGLGDESPVTVVDSGLGEVENNRYPLGRATASVDCRDYGDPLTGLVPASVASALRRINRLRFMLLCARLPVYSARTVGGLSRVTSGAKVDATLASVIGPDGMRGVDSHRCVVISAEMATDTREQSLLLLDLTPIQRATKRVAPSWQVQSVTSATEIDLKAAQFSLDDLATWVDGHPVLLYDKDGVLRSTDGPTDGSISGPTVILSAAWKAGGSAVTPNISDIIRLPAYDDGPGAAYWRNQAYIADDAAELGANKDQAHRWGW